ncbi:MAG: prepilin-type N-terminal cleavage/methylation domain-containing protein [Candidatus Hydrogenedentes bacterium]|nr:prepilin-type N-terminal cleavage/methylation domain-containing protein [Candidatus Hydrogenedentota bacterium]
MREKHGFTLIELMIVIAVLVIVMGLLFTLALNVQTAVASQEARIAGQDQVRNATQWLTRELRMATGVSVNSNAFPATSLTYRRADDIDGNGTAVDSGLTLETTGIRTIQRDAGDANGDGSGRDQLVMIDENGNVTVLANDLLPDEDANGNGTFDATEDTNFNGVLDRGLLFQQAGGGVLITIQSMYQPSPREQEQLSTMQSIVVPRN